MPTSSTFMTQAKRVSVSYGNYGYQWYTSIFLCLYAALFKELEQAVGFSVPLTLADMLI